MSGDKPSGFLSSIGNAVSKTVLDVNNSSLQGSLRLMMEQFFRQDVLKNVQQFEGEIVRVVHDPKEFSFSPLNFIKNPLQQNQIRYKVWVYDFGNLLTKTSNPLSDDTTEGFLINNLLPDFVVIDNNLSNLAVKDRVMVKFTDKINFTNGVIVSKKNLSPNAGTDNTPPPPPTPIPPDTSRTPAPQPAPTGNASKPSEQFKDKPVTNNVASNPDDINLTLYKWDNPKNPENVVADRTIKGRKVPGSDNQKYLAIEVAEELKKMFADAKKDGVNLYATSAYRGADVQIRLFNERWDINYETGRPDRQPKNPKIPGSKNTLNAAGKSKGLAAEPNPGAPHMTGRAVDIITTGVGFAAKFKSPEYIWLKDNAYKYGFFNSGATIISTPEAWHWSYRPNDKGKQSAIIEPPIFQKKDK